MPLRIYEEWFSSGITGNPPFQSIIVSDNCENAHGRIPTATVGISNKHEHAP